MSAVLKAPSLANLKKLPSSILLSLADQIVEIVAGRIDLLSDDDGHTLDPSEAATDAENAIHALRWMLASGLGAEDRANQCDMARDQTYAQWLFQL